MAEGSGVGHETWSVSGLLLSSDDFTSELVSSSVK